jgi:hypothetical protein
MSVSFDSDVLFMVQLVFSGESHMNQKTSNIHRRKGSDSVFLSILAYDVGTLLQDLGGSDIAEQPAPTDAVVTNGFQAWRKQLTPKVFF